MLGSDEGIKLVISDFKVLGTILGNVYVITLALDVGTDMGSLYGSFDFSNCGMLEGLFIGDSLIFTDNKMIGSDEGVHLGLYYG